MKNPIILIGTHRSGTTWLYSLLSELDGHVGWSEPKYVWEWGNNYKSDDILTEKDLTPKINKHIHDRFEKFVSENGGKRLVEKTPTNCLRMRFVLSVYPDAKIVHIVRDGRAILQSTTEMIDTGFFRPKKNTQRFFEMLRESPIWAIPAYMPQLFGMVYSKLMSRPVKFWGPKPEGWKQWVNTDSRNIMLAKQWSACVDSVLDNLDVISADNYCRVSYEDLLGDPEVEVAKLSSFLDLDKQQSSQLHKEISSTANSTQAVRWLDLINSDELEEIRPYMEPTMSRLGYSW